MSCHVFDPRGWEQCQKHESRVVRDSGPAAPLGPLRCPHLEGDPPCAGWKPTPPWLPMVQWASCPLCGRHPGGDRSCAGWKPTPPLELVPEEGLGTRRRAGGGKCDHANGRGQRLLPWGSQAQSSEPERAGGWLRAVRAAWRGAVAAGQLQNDVKAPPTKSVVPEEGLGTRRRAGGGKCEYRREGAADEVGGAGGGTRTLTG
jgi:hypothetical protein